MRLLLLSLPHSKLTREYWADAFCQKCINFTEICDMIWMDYKVFWVEWGEVKNLIPVMTDWEFKKIYTKNFSKEATERNNAEWRKLFIKNTIEEINKIKQPGDFVVCFYWRGHKAIVDWVQLPAIEPWIGYPSSNKERYRIFESYTWESNHYWKEWTMHPQNYNAVIHPYFPIIMYDFVEKSQNAEKYVAFIGRFNWDKWRKEAILACKELGIKIKLAGQEQDKANDEIKKLWCEDIAEHIGYVNPKQRSELLGNAIATMCLSRYIEPGGYVGIESMLCWTPIITTDYGCYVDYNIHWKTGYRCRLFNDIVEALKNVERLDRRYIREYAVNNYSLERAAKQYEIFFKRLKNLYDPKNGWGWFSKDIPTLDVAFYS